MTGSLACSFGLLDTRADFLSVPFHQLLRDVCCTLTGVCFFLRAVLSVSALPALGWRPRSLACSPRCGCSPVFSTGVWLHVLGAVLASVGAWLSTSGGFLSSPPFSSAAARAPCAHENGCCPLRAPGSGERWLRLAQRARGRDEGRLPCQEVPGQVLLGGVWVGESVTGGHQQPRWVSFRNWHRKEDDS